MPRVLVLTLTSVEGLKVSDELDILINGRLFRVDRAPEHVATELQLVLCCRGANKTKTRKQH